jgi:hypothetical protein
MWKIRTLKWKKKTFDVYLLDSVEISVNHGITRTLSLNFRHTPISLIIDVISPCMGTNYISNISRWPQKPLDVDFLKFFEKEMNLADRPKPKKRSK